MHATDKQKCKRHEKLDEIQQGTIFKHKDGVIMVNDTVKEADSL